VFSEWDVETTQTTSANQEGITEKGGKFSFTVGFDNVLIGNYTNSENQLLNEFRMYVPNT